MKKSAAPETLREARDYPGDDAYPLMERIRVAGLGALAREMKDSRVVLR